MFLYPSNILNICVFFILSTFLDILWQRNYPILNHEPSLIILSCLLNSLIFQFKLYTFLIFLLDRIQLYLTLMIVIILNFLITFFFLFHINSFPFFFCFFVFFFIGLLQLVPSIFTSFSSILHLNKRLGNFTSRQLLSWTLRSLLRWAFHGRSYLDCWALVWLFKWLYFSIASFKLPRRYKVVLLLRCHLSFLLMV